MGRNGLFIVSLGVHASTGGKVAKKKKMTKAQAAAARKEVTPQAVAKARSQQELKAIRETQRRVQREQRKSSGRIIVVGSIVVIAIVALAWVVTIGPGMLVGG